MDAVTLKTKTAHFRSAKGKAAQNKKAKERKRLRDAKAKAEKAAMKEKEVVITLPQEVTNHDVFYREQNSMIPPTVALSEFERRVQALEDAGDERDIHLCILLSFLRARLSNRLYIRKESLRPFTTIFSLSSSQKAMQPSVTST